MSKFLFIGNSHTYFNDMPEIFRQVCEANGVAAEVVMLALGGKSFAFHAKEPQTRFNILYGGYDYVVLQHCAHPMGNLEEFEEAGAELVRMVEYTDAIPILYMTWAEKENRAGQEAMSEAYQKLGRKLRVAVAPVGEAWWQAIDQGAGELYAEDGQHASEIGSKLVAYTIFSTIFGKKPVPLERGDEVLCDVAGCKIEK